MRASAELDIEVGLSRAREYLEFFASDTYNSTWFQSDFRSVVWPYYELFFWKSDALAILPLTEFAEKLKTEPHFADNAWHEETTLLIKFLSAENVDGRGSIALKYATNYGVRPQYIRDVANQLAIDGAAPLTTRRLMEAADQAEAPR